MYNGNGRPKGFPPVNKNTMNHIVHIDHIEKPSSFGFYPMCSMFSMWFKNPLSALSKKIVCSTWLKQLLNAQKNGSCAPPPSPERLGTGSGGQTAVAAISIIKKIVCSTWLKQLFDTF